jgi:hypothetical protein
VWAKALEEEEKKTGEGKEREEKENNTPCSNVHLVSG